MSKKSRFEINKMKRDSSFSMKSPHSHSYYELYYLVSGECVLSIGNNFWHLSGGSIAIIPPDVAHGTSYAGNVNAQRICIEFSQNYIAPICNSPELYKLFEPLTYTPVFVSAHSSANCMRIIDELLSENQSYEISGELYKTCLLIELLISLIRDFHSIPLMTHNKSHDNTIQMALLYIERNFRTNITLEKLAGIYHLNPSYFSKKFKEECGTGFKEYLSNLRIVHSEKLLLETKKSITEISFECGFESSNYYGDAFRKKNGISPSKFRQLKGNF